MKWIKEFRLFESNEWDMESIKERLIDLNHMGFKTSISKSSSIIIDFERVNPEQFQRNPFIKSHEVAKYDGGMASNSLTIDAKSSTRIEINIDELESVYGDLCNFLESKYGLRPNYIYLLSSAGIQYVYFKNFSDIKEFIEVSQPTNPNVIETDGLTFGFYN